MKNPRELNDDITFASAMSGEIVAEREKKPAAGFLGPAAKLGPKPKGGNTSIGLIRTAGGHVAAEGITAQPAR